MEHSAEHFEFIDPGELIDGDLQLMLALTRPGDLSRGQLPGYSFDMKVGGHTVGELRMRVGYTDATLKYFGHLGYDVEPEHRGHHYAERACRLVLPLARAHGMDTAWIMCNPANIASRRTCERLGAQYVDTVPIPEDNILYEQGNMEACRYCIDLSGRT